MGARGGEEGKAGDEAPKKAPADGGKAGQVHVEMNEDGVKLDFLCVK